MIPLATCLSSLFAYMDSSLSISLIGFSSYFILESESFSSAFVFKVFFDLKISPRIEPFFDLGLFISLLPPSHLKLASVALSLSVCL